MKRDTTKTDDPKKMSIPAMIGGGLAGVVGWVVGNYSGLFLLIPAGLAAVSGFLLSVLVPKNNRPMVPASAIQVGQAIWIGMGVFATRSYNNLLIQIFVNFNPLCIEPIVYLLFALLLAFRPTIWIVAPLVMYQLPSILINGLAFADATPKTNNHKALLVHIVLRGAAVCMMVFGLIRLHKTSTAGDSATSGIQETGSKNLTKLDRAPTRPRKQKGSS